MNVTPGLYTPVSKGLNSVEGEPGAIPVCTKISLHGTQPVQIIATLYTIAMLTYLGPASFTSSLESNVLVVNLKWASPRVPGCHTPFSYIHTVHSARMDYDVIMM